MTEWHRGQSEIQPSPPPDVKPPQIEPPSREDVDPPAGQCGLELISPLEDVPTLDSELVGYLRQIGICRVDSFLELELEDAVSQLGAYGITQDIVQRRQREILMMLYVAVTPLEAQLLVACGVPDPERLGRADEGVLLRRVETILDRPQAASRFGTADLYSLQRILGWIQKARRSTYRGRAPRARLSQTNRSKTPRDVSQRRLPITLRDSTELKDSDNRDTVKIHSDCEMRFYLEPSDPVVDAPSIGPKTAARLHEIDIHTLADLFIFDAEDVAVQLGERRITSDTVLRWQLQAQLVCRIPNLRGHDAQILVACGVEDPGKLATLDASSFLQQVNRFVATKEGQRILRNGKRPDLAEVTSWIECSQNARQLRAA